MHFRLSLWSAGNNIRVWLVSAIYTSILWELLITIKTCLQLPVAGGTNGPLTSIKHDFAYKSLRSWLLGLLCSSFLGLFSAGLQKLIEPCHIFMCSFQLYKLTKMKSERVRGWLVHHKVNSLGSLSCPRLLSYFVKNGYSQFLCGSVVHMSFQYIFFCRTFFQLSQVPYFFMPLPF